MTGQDVVDKARAAGAAKAVIYKLGAGGLHPEQDSPANMDGECDCSGFVCWCLGISRKTTHPLYVKFNGGWINTDAIVHDAETETGFFTGMLQPQVGALVVFPSSKLRPVGHVGIVASVVNGGVSSVIHCSHGNFTKFGNAVQETAPTVFGVPDAIFAWYEGLEGVSFA